MFIIVNYIIERRCFFMGFIKKDYNDLPPFEVVSTDNGDYMKIDTLPKTDKISIYLLDKDIDAEDIMSIIDDLNTYLYGERNIDTLTGCCVVYEECEGIDRFSSFF